MRCCVRSHNNRSHHLTTITSTSCLGMLTTPPFSPAFYPLLSSMFHARRFPYLLSLPSFTRTCRFLLLHVTRLLWFIAYITLREMFNLLSPHTLFVCWQVNPPIPFLTSSHFIPSRNLFYNLIILMQHS